MPPKRATAAPVAVAPAAKKPKTQPGQSSLAAMFGPTSAVAKPALSLSSFTARTPALPTAGKESVKPVELPVSNASLLSLHSKSTMFAALTRAPLPPSRPAVAQPSVSVTKPAVPTAELSYFDPAVVVSEVLQSVPPAFFSVWPADPSPSAENKAKSIAPDSLRDFVLTILQAAHTNLLIQSPRVSEYSAEKAAAILRQARLIEQLAASVEKDGDCCELLEGLLTLCYSRAFKRQFESSSSSAFKPIYLSPPSITLPPSRLQFWLHAEQHFRNALLWNPRTPIPAVKVVLNASNKINEEKQRVWMQDLTQFCMSHHQSASAVGIVRQVRTIQRGVDDQPSLPLYLDASALQAVFKSSPTRVSQRSDNTSMNGIALKSIAKVIYRRCVDMAAIQDDPLGSISIDSFAGAVLATFQEHSSCSAALFEAFSIATVSNPLDSLDMTSHVTQHSDHLSVPSPLLLTGAAVTPLELLSSNQATQQSNQLQRHAESTALKNGAHSVLGHLLNMLCETVPIGVCWFAASASSLNAYVRDLSPGGSECHPLVLEYVVLLLVMHELCAVDVNQWTQFNVAAAFKRLGAHRSIARRSCPSLVDLTIAARSASPFDPLTAFSNDARSRVNADWLQFRLRSLCAAVPQCQDICNQVGVSNA